MLKKLFASALLLSLALPLTASAGDYRPGVAAHRGASGYLPEHTLPAKAMAYAMGVDYIEQDVVMSKDGKLLVMHDTLLDTTTDVAKRFPDRARKDGRFYSSDFTYDELRSLRVTERFDVKTGKPVFSGRFPDSPIAYQIPSLEEEFLQVQGLNKSTGRNVSVYVEVKEPVFFQEQGLDILKATIDMMTKYGYNSMESKAILQIFDYEAVVRARELGWKGELAMLVTASGQGHIDDKARHAWLQTDEGLRDVAKYATIYAPNFNLLAVPTEDAKAYTISDLGDRARKAGMKLHSWTLREDSLPKGFRTFGEVLDVAFKTIKVDGMFSDFPDILVKYLKDNDMR
ncbi:MAG: glycerophosphodiester phosphodiesterase [Desulfovibrionaceae bacterium]|nr:glycerophosphodiester phosphodiesterase [Desulfovibrionaceae bacterium]